MLIGHTDWVITPVTVNHAANDNSLHKFNLSNVLHCAIWLIWHRKVRMRDVQCEKKPSAVTQNHSIDHELAIIIDLLS